MQELPVRERIASMTAECLEDNTLVNVGIGIPGLVPHYTPDERQILFHAEQGVIGFGSDRFGPDDSPVLQFFGTSYRMRPGGFISDHTRSFALVRSGRLDVTVLGAFEIEATGMLANFQSATMGSGCPGGSPELAGAAKRVVVAMEHTNKDGRPRLVHRTKLAIGPTQPAEVVVTELGWFEPAGDGFVIRRLADGVSEAEVAAVTDAEVRWAPAAPGTASTAGLSKAIKVTKAKQ
ncbi:MAG: 3-oxoacid CoA-transferase B subunit [Acidimicrobiales bacterium]|jgi:3-oxoacid CoA-transferase B subunit